MTRRLPSELFAAFRPPPQVRFGTVTSVGTGICTVRVAGGEIPAVTINSSSLSVGDFVTVQRQGAASYVLSAPGGAIWLAGWSVAIDNGAGLAYRVTLGGQQSYLVLGTVASTLPPQDCALGADKNVWFTANLGGVWRVSPKGGVTFFPLPGSGPTGICAGPDGNLWVADGLGGVWRVGTDGSGVFFPLRGTYLTAFYWICAGPDGNLWATDSGNEAVWRITTSGDATPFESPDGLNSGLQGIARGPLGSVWVADEYENCLWQVTMAGEFIFHDMSAVAPVALQNLVEDGSGALWITDHAPRLIRYVPGSVPESLDLVPGGPAWGICIGSDGNVWAATTGGETLGVYLYGVKASGMFAAYELMQPIGTLICLGICAGP